jgi:hypothetical protein
MISPKHAAFAAVMATAFGLLGSSGAAAMPVDTRLAARAAEDSNVQQVWYYRRAYWGYGYARPYWRPRYYGYAPAYYGYPRYYPYYAYRPAYYYGYPRYSYWGYRPGITISFGFGPRWGW